MSPHTIGYVTHTVQVSVRFQRQPNFFTVCHHTHSNIGQQKLVLFYTPTFTQIQLQPISTRRYTSASNYNRSRYADTWLTDQGKLVLYHSVSPHTYTQYYSNRTIRSLTHGVSPHTHVILFDHPYAVVSSLETGQKNYTHTHRRTIPLKHLQPIISSLEKNDIHSASRNQQRPHRSAFCN